MMLDKARPNTLNQNFRESVKALDRMIRKAQLIRQIEQRSQDVDNASTEEMAQILADLKEYRQQIWQLDQQC